MLWIIGSFSVIYLGFVIYKEFKLQTIRQLKEEQRQLLEDIKNKKILMQELERVRDKYIQQCDEYQMQCDEYEMQWKEYEDRLNQLKTDIINYQKRSEAFKAATECIVSNFTEERKKYEILTKAHQDSLDTIFKGFIENKLKIISEYDDDIDKKKKYIETYNQEQIRKKQKETEQEFYCLELNESAKQDVIKLMNLADELHNPDVLLKLVYKTYFEKPMNDLLTRVVGVNSEKSGIYKITNVLYNEAYIGQTVNFKDRWRTHLKKGLGIEAPVSNKFYQAMKKYKPWNFTFEVLAFCDRDKLNETEKYWIDFYQTNKWGYNSKGGNE